MPLPRNWGEALYRAFVETPAEPVVTNPANPTALRVAQSDAAGNTLTLTPTGNASIYRNLDVGVTGQVVKASAGTLVGYYVYNTSAALRYLKLYDKATAPTQADTPVLTWPLTSTGGANAVLPGVPGTNNGFPFANGISIRATTGIADNDTGAPSANDVVVNLLYR